MINRQYFDFYQIVLRKELGMSYNDDLEKITSPFTLPLTGYFYE